MERDGKEIKKKWAAFINEIKEKFISAELQELYPNKTLLKYYITLPIDSIEKEYLHLGQCFYIYLVENKFEIEWIKHNNWTPEELKCVDNKVDDILKNTKWN